MTTEGQSIAPSVSTFGGSLQLLCNFGPPLTIDVAAGTVTGSIGVGDGPRSVAFSLDGRVAYVANLGSDDVSVIDVATGTVTATIGVGESPQSVAFAPGG